MELVCCEGNTDRSQCIDLTDRESSVCKAICFSSEPVSFSQLKDPEERKYLNKQPTSFALPGEAVDRLRAAAGQIIVDSPEYQRLQKDAGATNIVDTQEAP